MIVVSAASGAFGRLVIDRLEAVATVLAPPASSAAGPAVPG
ncbi:hypothetical protein [Streptomyces sp. NBC_01334]|nr:hypothetical protein OG736_00230 [Streptomyces sp. NBC_01334]WSN45248.1 hypothetical protein OG736_44305 [Streptomyces sp. NBC_01334]